MFANGPADATATHSLLLQKIQIGLPFWYRLTWTVPDKGPLNGCLCKATETKINETTKFKTKFQTKAQKLADVLLTLLKAEFSVS